MEFVVAVILLILGFIVLIKGADFFVDGAASLAENFKLSKMLIGLTIVSFGTSAPEFAVSIKSLLSGSSDIIIGNVVGSNIVNILLILGVCSFIHSLTVKNNTVKKEIPILLLLTTLFITLLSDTFFDGKLLNRITRVDGIVILLFFAVFIYYLFSMMRNKMEKETGEKPPYSILKSVGFTILGLIAIILGSDLVVDNAKHVAIAFGVSERVIALTVIAFGTSLPELVTSMTATKKREYDIAIGNVVGSNIFNIGIVIGLPVALLGSTGIVNFHLLDIIFFFISTLLLFFFSYNDYKISKKEGSLFLILFAIYIIYLFLS